MLLAKRPISRRTKVRDGSMTTGLRYADASGIDRIAGVDTDAAARGADVRRFDIGRPLRNRLQTGVLHVGVLLREHRVAAGIVYRHTVDGEADLVGTEAADGQATERPVASWL